MDTSFGLVTTTADRIAARTDPWDPETEPSPGEFVDPGAQERKRVLLAEAERELDEFIGLDKVKDQVARLKSAVAMELVRKQRGWRWPSALTTWCSPGRPEPARPPSPA